MIDAIELKHEHINEEAQAAVDADEGPRAPGMVAED